MQFYASFIPQSIAPRVNTLGPNVVLGVWMGNSKLVALESAVELNEAEPVVVGGLGLVPSVAVESSSSAEVHCYGSVQHEVDH